MPQPHAVAVHPSLFSSAFKRPLWAFFIACCLSIASTADAQLRTSKTEQAPYVAQEQPTSYLGRIGFNNPEQVAEALMRVEGLYEFDAGAQLVNPVSIIVHGPEVSIFEKENYQEHKEIVDLAAKLSALGVLNINVCEFRLNRSGGSKETVYPFVGTVPFGPKEVDRLLNEENYVYF